MITVNPAKLKRIGGSEAVALTRKNLKSAAWATLFGVFVCTGHLYGLHGGWQYAMLSVAGFQVITHLWNAWRYWRQLKILQQGGEIFALTSVPRNAMNTPWILDLVAMVTLSAFVLPFIGFPWIIILGSYVWWEKTLAFSFSAGATWLLAIAWKKAFKSRSDQIRFNNALWRLKAIAAIPQLQKYIAQENSVSELWITLCYFFEQAYEPDHRDDRLIRDTYAFAEWSLLSSGGELPEDEAKDLKEGAASFYDSASKSPFAGPDCINHVSHGVRVELERIGPGVAL